MKYTFETRQDYIDSLYKMITPLSSYYDSEIPGKLLIGQGTSGTVYSQSTREVEGFLRVLWGIGPLLVHNSDDKLSKIVVEGLRVGTDPDSSHYWGTPKNYDQLIVEMAALSTTLLLNPELWDRLSSAEQDNVFNWLNTVNSRKTPKNNWLFFRILVNVCFKKLGRAFNQEIIEEDFKEIEAFYIGNGWYYDGRSTQMDYYISFAIHYYSLIYCKFMEDSDKARTDSFKKRAKEFAESFQYWFDANGEAIPFGRSLTYRFAQSAFWSALVFADVEALPRGEIKGILERNMTSWCEHDIFLRDGRLTIGYHYENLVMAEGYNGSGSPYWAFKTFLLLAVDVTHPFWSSQSIEKQSNKSEYLIPEAQMLVQTSPNQVQSFVAGQFEPNQAHIEAKYSKLVYSTVFGFSVPKSHLFYRQGGFDNCLALSEDDSYYRTKFKSDSFEVTQEYVKSIWKPWSNVEVSTLVVPMNGWHVRVHDIETQRELIVRDGGFATPIEEINVVEEHNKMTCESSIGTSVLVPLEGFEDMEYTTNEPNTSLFFKNSGHPSSRATLSIGKHRLISLVGGIASGDSEWLRQPVVQVENNILIIIQGDSKKAIQLSSFI